jgi:hypothetical protein
MSNTAQELPLATEEELKIQRSNEIEFASRIHRANQQQTQDSDESTIADSINRANNEQQEKVRLTDLSAKTWELVQDVHSALQEGEIPTDIDILDARGLGEYTVSVARHRAPSTVPRYFREHKDRRIAEKHRSEGWNLNTRLGDAKNGKSLVLGEDGRLYLLGKMRSKTRELRIVVPEHVMRAPGTTQRSGDPLPGEEFASISQCEQAIDGLASLIAKYNLPEPEDGWAGSKESNQDNDNSDPATEVQEPENSETTEENEPQTEEQPSEDEESKQNESDAQRKVAETLMQEREAILQELRQEKAARLVAEEQLQQAKDALSVDVEDNSNTDESNESSSAEDLLEAAREEISLPEPEVDTNDSEPQESTDGDDEGDSEEDDEDEDDSEETPKSNVTYKLERSSKNKLKQKKNRVAREVVVLRGLERVQEASDKTDAPETDA